MKFFDKNRLKKEDMGPEIRNEVILMKMVDHPNVVKIVEVLSSRSKLYLVLELVKGGDCRQYLDKNEKFTE